MADISLQSEKFIALFEKAEPVLQKMAKAEPTRAMQYEMPAYHPGSVIRILDDVNELAKQAVQLAGPAASHVVLASHELTMLRWALQQK